MSSLALKESPTRSVIFGRDIANARLKLQAKDLTLPAVAALRKLGLDMPIAFVQDQMEAMLRGATWGADDAQGLITTASISTPLQFLQTWLPGFIQTLTAARKIDILIGVRTVGAWEDEEIVQGIVEPLGAAVPYGDYSNIPLANWNVNWERRSVARFEQGFEVGRLEDARSARIRINTAAKKRAASQQSLDITRNMIGFYGYNNGASRIYGFLNDPNLPPYVTAAATGTGSTTTWSTKSFGNITADLRGMAARLQTRSRDNIDPEKDALTLVVSTAVKQYLTVTTDFGMSVAGWIKETYPNWRIESAPELDGANGGANVAYLYADKVDDGSDDGGGTWSQLVPSRFMALGTERTAKTYKEDFSNATAGVLLARPFAVERLTGI